MLVGLRNTLIAAKRIYADGQVVELRVWRNLPGRIVAIGPFSSLLFVAIHEGDYSSDYWDKLWHWYREEDGFAKVAYYLRHVVDLSDFNPKASPPKTEAFWAIVHANTGEETTDLGQLIELLGTPKAITLDQVVFKARTTSGFEGTAAWFSDQRHYRIVSEKFEKCGYRVFRNPRDAKHGQWQFKDKRRAVYVLKGLSDAEAMAAIAVLQGEPPPPPPEPDDPDIPF
jgi:hypothetical protein